MRTRGGGGQKSENFEDIISGGKDLHLVDVVLREWRGVPVDGPELGVGEGLLLAEAAQVDLAAAGRVVAGGAPDVAPLAVPERGLRVRGGLKVGQL